MPAQERYHMFSKCHIGSVAVAVNASCLVFGGEGVVVVALPSAEEEVPPLEQAC